ncbi:MAG: SDR family NAD(P)-dependent oxidoreductase [Candidatus Nitrosopumilus sp. bin_7KS]
MVQSKKIKNLISLKNKTSVITGGSGHLGASISEALGEMGSNLVLIGQRENEGIKFAKKLVKEYKIKVKFEKVDLNSQNSIDTFFKHYDGNIDVLINNGFTWPKTVQFEKTSWDEFQDTLTSGVTSPFYFTKLAIKKMRTLDSGSIINIGSMYGMVSPNFKIYRNKPNMGNAVAYNASKAAMIQMTKYFAVSCSKWNIRVNCISPGPFPRPGTFVGKKWFEKELKSMTPLNRTGQPWELKGGILLLATELGSYITGQNIVIDGGWTIW